MVFVGSDDHRDLDSFPTRRSSDLRSRRCSNRIDRAVAQFVPNKPVPRWCSHAAPQMPSIWREIRRAIWKAFAALHAKDRKSTRLNSSHVENSYAVFCLKNKTTGNT